MTAALVIAAWVLLACIVGPLAGCCIEWGES